MTKKLLFITALLVSSFNLFAQMGEVWPTYSRQDFTLNSNAEIIDESQTVEYFSYYLFINNNEFIHCTNNITSLYKIISRKSSPQFEDYTVVSEVGNTYMMRFAKKDKYIVTTSIDKGFSVYAACYEPYNTQVFNNINR